MFDIHRSSYKYWKRRPKAISAAQAEVRALVKEAHNASNGSAGARTIADIVTQTGINLSRYRATKIMKALGLVSRQMPKHRYKKQPLEHIAIPNHLDRQFAVTAPNMVWVGDVTYVWLVIVGFTLQLSSIYLLENLLVGPCLFHPIAN